VSTIRLPLSDGRLLAELHRNGEVLSQTTDDDAIVVTARVDDALAGRLRPGGAQVTA
jgi:GTP-binding protein HflX